MKDNASPPPEKRIRFFYSVFAAAFFLLAGILLLRYVRNEFRTLDDVFLLRSAAAPEQARGILEAMREKPEPYVVVDVLLELASGAVNRKDYDDAAGFAQMALESGASRSCLFRAGMMLGYCDFFRGREEEARRRLRALLEEEDLSGDMRAEIENVLRWDREHSR